MFHHLACIVKHLKKAARLPLSLSRFRTAGTFMLLSVVLYAQQSPQQPTADLPDLLRTKTEQVQDSAQSYLLPAERICNAQAIKDFYSQRNYAPIWLAGRYFMPASQEFVHCIDNSRFSGLLPADYHYQTIQELVQTTQNSANEDILTDLANLELLMTDAFMQLGKHLQSGKINPEKIGITWKPQRLPFNMQLVLSQAVTSGTPFCNALQSLEPQHPEYAQLKQLLQIYENLTPWEPIKASWNLLLQKGDRNPMVTEVRKRLQITGDLSPEAPLTEVFDKELETAVMLFQRRHGLYYDGLVRSNVINELNVSLATRIDQIKANLERWRWAPDSWGSTYVLVNVPEYRLTMFEDGVKSYSEAIIVGRENYPTPSFNDTITYMVLNPYWYVPASIVKNELMKEVHSDANYFINNDINVFKGNKRIDPTAVDWKKADLTQYAFRQGASAYNPMGVVKFMFPNQYDIYLHDTPSRELFNNSRRSYSHGCVRINQPLEFALHLLRSDPTWSKERVESVIHSQKETIVNLKKPIPIYLVYQTAFVNSESGEVNFREDIYGWDKKIAQLLAEKTNL